MWRNILLVAGPCAAESRDQVLNTAESLSSMGVDIYRASLWKPRTHPGTFEGVGEEGLKWLKEAQDRNGFRAATEVASQDHVKACLESGLNTFWIGARTVSNPFLVEEIAESLRGSGATVLVKNPISPDLELWTGAVERLVNAEINDVVLVHRGVTPGRACVYRNDPRWEMAVSMHLRFPSLRMICDPSHIAGKRELVPELSSRALALGMDGLMVEVHPNPDEAKSDSSQQLSIELFKTLLDGLSPRKNNSEDDRYARELSLLRSRIDSIDMDLCSLLSERLSVTRKIGELKRSENVSILQPERWREVLEMVDSYSRNSGLDPSYLRHIFNLIHEESVMDQDTAS